MAYEAIIDQERELRGGERIGKLMIECVSINLPDYYTRLLQVDMHATGKNFENLSTYIFQNPGFYGLIENCFQDIGDDTGVNHIVKAMGWHGLRDRLAGIFLYYKLNNRFPIFSMDLNVAGLLDLEEKAKDYTSVGQSRGFLLAFYLKMAEVHSESVGKVAKNLPVIDDELIQILSYAKIKILKIDWMLLLLAHFREFLGISKLKTAQDRGCKYQELFECLSWDQREVLVGNLLSYGSSISDECFFEAQ